MKSKLMGLAATLVKGRKFTLAIVGAQFAYLGYKFIKSRTRKRKPKKQ